MDDKVSLFEQIQTSADKEAILKLLLLQLEKDFGEFGLIPEVHDIHFGNLDLLKNRVSTQLRKADIRSGNQLMSLFYRIDVAKKILNQGMELSMDERYPFWAMEVLNRELKKVMTKLAFANLNKE